MVLKHYLIYYFTDFCFVQVSYKVFFNFLNNDRKSKT